MHKVRKSMKSNEKFSMDENVYVDEFVLGGRENVKVGRNYDSKNKNTVTAVQLTDHGKVKRMYAIKIDNFSAKEFTAIFEKYSSKDAKITTDLWKGYHPILEDYNIT